MSELSIKEFKTRLIFRVQVAGELAFSERLAKWFEDIEHPDFYDIINAELKRRSKES